MRARTLALVALLGLAACVGPARPREPRVTPRVLLTSPACAWLLDLLNLNLDEPVPEFPPVEVTLFHWEW